MHATRAARARALGWRFVCALSLAATVVVFALFGCREEFVNDIDTNRAPDTYLTGAPPESTTTFYRVHLYWYGNDADGVVTGYEWAISDSLPGQADTLDYAYTTVTDSVFLMPVSERQQVLGHRFWVRAIDNEGKVDPEPAFAFFGAADPTPPVPYFTLAEAWLGPAQHPTWRMVLDDSTNTRTPTDTLPAGASVRFRWTGYDGDWGLDEFGNPIHVGNVTGYEHFLFPGQAAQRGGPADTVASYTDLQNGKYEFRLRAFDDAGFAGLDPALRTFVWNMDPETFFFTGVTPDGDTLPHCFVTSPAWTGAHEFFYGDTIPLTADAAGRIVTNTIHISFDGRDPDDLLGTGVSAFEWRSSAGIWSSPSDTLRNISQTSRRADDFDFQVRCQDGYGRKDGSPPKFRISVDKQPVLRDTITVDPLVLQYPMEGENVSLAQLAAWGWKLPVRVIARDPDHTVKTFDYQFRLMSAIYTPQTALKPNEGQPAEIQLNFNPSWPTGSYVLQVKVAERGFGLRSNEPVIHFNVVP